MTGSHLAETQEADVPLSGSSVLRGTPVVPGVGYGPVTVNRHRLDLLVLDPALGVVARFERRLWDEDAVVDAVQRCASSKS